MANAIKPLLCCIDLDIPIVYFYGKRNKTHCFVCFAYSGMSMFYLNGKRNKPMHCYLF